MPVKKPYKKRLLQVLPWLSAQFVGAVGADTVRTEFLYLEIIISEKTDYNVV